MQRSTHSSQIYIFGPAMSFRTWFSVLLQNEHLKVLNWLFRRRDHMFSTNLNALPLSRRQKKEPSIS